MMPITTISVYTAIGKELKINSTGCLPTYLLIQFTKNSNGCVVHPLKPYKSY